MSSQDGSGIPFEIFTTSQSLRLLELPPPLLELIRSDHPPNLMLKSKARTNDVPQQTPAYAVLCTNNHTYQVRQVQSSNSVFIVQPSERQSTLDGSRISATGLAAIAQCPTLLELIPSSSPSLAFLKQHLPLYTGSEGPGGVRILDADPADLLDRQSKTALLQDAPFSTGEFEHAWKDVCAFESGDRCWVPAAQALANCWSAIISAATVRSLDLGEATATTALAGTVEEDGHPLALLEAILARLSADDQDMIDGYAKLDKAKTVPWVGVVLLESQTTSRTNGIPVTDFLRLWQDQMPEGWRNHASLEALKGSFWRPSKSVIAFDDNGSAGSAALSAVPKAATAKAKPNWHEKFKNTKR